MDKERKKFIRRRIGWYALRVFTFFTGVLPLGWSYAVGGTLGNMFYLFVVRHRKIALDSLAIAFPQMSLKKRKKMARDFFVFMLQSAFEMLYFLRNTDKLSGIRIEGRAHLDEALKRNKGVIAVTGHFGNFPLMSLKLAKEGYAVAVMTRPLRDPKAGDYFYTLRTNAGVKTIFSYPRKVVVNSTIKALRDNEIVTIQMDQNFGTGGVWVKFFDKLAATPVGPIVFALRTGACILPMYIVREAKGKHTVKILPPQELTVTEDKDETVLINAIKFTRIIEQWVRECPSQWGWVHRRWKSRPTEEMRKKPFKVEED